MSPDGSVNAGKGKPPGHKLDRDDGGAHTRKAGFVVGSGTLSRSRRFPLSVEAQGKKSADSTSPI